MDTENQEVVTDNMNADENVDVIDITDIEKEKEKERERELEKIKAKERAKKRKLIPPFVMLLAGAIISITMFVSHYKLKDMLIVLLCVLVVFFIAGEIIKYMLDRFEAQIEEARMDEGEVYEKEPDETGDTNN